jgi:hypothetical protein
MAIAVGPNDLHAVIELLPGHFSGIHLCAIMYAAFKHFAPHQDVGIDFSKEWEIAMGMRG